MRSGKVSLHAVWKALDEAAFGSKNTLNLRESLPTPADARYRAEAWLRERQMSKAGELLVVTGRGNNSHNGVSPVREAILSLLPVLRRRGVVSEWREHSPGSFVVKPAAITAMLEAPRRRRDRGTGTPTLPPNSIAQLEPATIDLLRRLAVRSLEALGVREPDKFVDAEMIAKFNTLAAGIQPGIDGEERLRAAMLTALEQLDD
ncbi:MAG: hypothetical protein ABR585_12945 [Gemmatimonadaceae bacterium]